MTQRILVLDSSLYPDSYEPFAHWAAAFGPVEAVRVHISFGQVVPALDSFTHLVLTGSEASVAGPEPWFEPLAAVVRQAVDQGLPILGSCFGHQMLAQVMIGPPHVAASATPEVGWIEVEIVADDPILAGVPRPWRVFVSHFDEVRRLPEPWRVLARSAGCAVQVMRFGERPIWGFQAHPEMSTGDGRRLLNGFLQRAPGKASFLVPALEQTPMDDNVAARIAQNFLHM